MNEEINMLKRIAETINAYVTYQETIGKENIYEACGVFYKLLYSLPVNIQISIEEMLDSIGW